MSLLLYLLGHLVGVLAWLSSWCMGDIVCTAGNVCCLHLQCIACI